MLLKCPTGCGKARISGIRPQDYTRKALVEARRSGIHPFCITIDTHGRDYLPHMYGAANYVVIDEVGNIYRRLTI